MQKLNWLMLPLLMSLGGQSLFSSDTVLVNGHIYTANTQGAWVEALAVTGDKIDAAGSNADIARHRTAGIVLAGNPFKNMRVSRTEKPASRARRMIRSLPTMLGWYCRRLDARGGEGSNPAFS